MKLGLDKTLIIPLIWINIGLLIGAGISARLSYGTIAGLSQLDVKLANYLPTVTWVVGTGFVVTVLWSLNNMLCACWYYNKQYANQSNSSCEPQLTHSNSNQPASGLTAIMAIVVVVILLSSVGYIIASVSYWTIVGVVIHLKFNFIWGLIAIVTCTVCPNLIADYCYKELALLTDK